MREQIIALIQGELKQSEVTALVRELARSPEECEFLHDQIDLSKTFRQAWSAVVSDPDTDRLVWERIGRIDAASAVPPSIGSVATAGRTGLLKSIRFWLAVAAGAVALTVLWLMMRDEDPGDAMPDAGRSASRVEAGAEAATAESGGEGGVMTADRRVASGIISYDSAERVASDRSDVSAYPQEDAPREGRSGFHASYARGSASRILAFDGIDDCIVESDESMSLDPSGSFTVEAYVRPESLDGRRWLLAYSVPGAGAGLLFGFDDGRLRMTAYDRSNVGNEALAFTRLFPGMWYHVAGVYDRTANALRIFVNGRLEGETIAGRIDSTRGMGVISLGGWSDGSGTRPSGAFRGLIREVRFWNRPFDQEEIAGLLGQSIEENQPDLAARWSLQMTASGNEKRLPGIVGRGRNARILGGAEWKPVDDILFSGSGH